MRAASKSGHAPCFTTGDALGFAVIRYLVDDVGLRIGSVAGAGPALFELCKTVSWHVLEASYLLLDVGRAEVDCVFSLPPSPKSDAVVVVALRPIVGRLRAQLGLGTLLGHGYPVASASEAFDAEFAP